MCSSMSAFREGVSDWVGMEVFPPPRFLNLIGRLLFLLCFSVCFLYVCVCAGGVV